MSDTRKRHFGMYLTSQNVIKIIMTLIEQYRIINHFYDIITFTLAKVNKKF